MALTFWLVLPRRVWREQIPILARSTGMGVAHLTRNFYQQTHEFIATALRPLSPMARSRQFGPLDDLLLVRIQPEVESRNLDELLAGFSPLPMQVVVGLVLGRGRAAGRWLGGVWEEGRGYPLEGFTLVGPGMRQVVRERLHAAEESHSPSERWSRTRGALGDAVWQRVRRSRVLVAGAGRNGSVAALTLAMLGVAKLVLIDDDQDELHNLDATLGATPAKLRRPKVQNRAEMLKSIRPDDLEVEAIPHSLLDTPAAEALRRVDLIVTAVDRDGPRLRAALAARRWCKVHLDIGTGIFGTGAARQMGSDVRLLSPGEACVCCLGGLRDLEQARREEAAPPGALWRGPQPEWYEQRAGELPSRLARSAWRHVLLRNKRCAAVRAPRPPGAGHPGGRGRARANVRGLPAHGVRHELPAAGPGQGHEPLRRVHGPGRSAPAHRSARGSH